MYENLYKNKIENNLLTDQYDTKIKLLNQNLTNAIAEKANLDASTKKMLNEMGAIWAEIRIAQQNANTNEKNADTAYENMRINDRKVNYDGRDTRVREKTLEWNKIYDQWESNFRATQGNNERIDRYVDRALGVVSGGIINRSK